VGELNPPEATLPDIRFSQTSTREKKLVSNVLGGSLEAPKPLEGKGWILGASIRVSMFAP